MSMPARLMQPQTMLDRPIASAGVVLPVPDDLGAVVPVSSSPWVISLSDPTTSTAPRAAVHIARKRAKIPLNPKPPRKSLQPL